MSDVLLYRLYRLRRTLVFGIAPTVALVWALSASSGQNYPYLAILAVLIPSAHVLRYPNNWTETLTVSLVTAICLALATTISPDLTFVSHAIRIFWLVFLWFVMFFILISPITELALRGATSDDPSHTVGHSRLPADTLRKTLTYYPGRSDDKVICGEADAEGRFPVTIRLTFAPPTFQDDPIPEMADMGISQEGVMECYGHAVIHSTGPDHHNVFYYDEDGNVTASSYTFEDLGKNGTRITLQEAGTPMTAGDRFGMWVSDYLADYLTDCIDRAEGRAPRANRAFPHKQLVVELANILVPWMNAWCGEEPTDDRF